MQNNYRISIWLIAGIVLTANLPIILEQVNAETIINGAGATFPFPLIDTWRVEYKNVKPDVNINYQSIGSGGGIKQFTEKTVDFGATDAPLNEEEEKKVSNGAVHIPETIGSVAIPYNLPQITDSELKLTGPIIAEIFMGKITKWDDPKIKEINPDIELPSESIIVAHRSDGSGTTFVFTEYLSNVSSQWEAEIGKGKSIQWPVGIGAPGNEGVSGSVKSTPNSIGYIELAYALTTDLNFASIQNKEGKFIKPSLESTSAAVTSSASNLPNGTESWKDVSIVNPGGIDSYPIATFTYILLFKELSTNSSIDESKAKELIDFISWAITDGQEFAPDLGYVPLPEEIIKLDQETLKSVTFKGNPIIP
jgi:phosphate ABC transporter phosphate-binding protein